MDVYCGDRLVESAVIPEIISLDGALVTSNGSR